MSLRKALRRKGIWLDAREAKVILRALRRAGVQVTEPNADVIVKFMRRCEELE